MRSRVRRVPRPDWIIPHPESAAGYAGISDVKDSPYFKAPDFYSMKSNDKGLTMLTNYPTYQQTTCYSCGPAAALTVLWYFGVTCYDEPELMRRMGTSGVPNERGEGGTCTAGICRFFEEIGWKVCSSLRECRGGENIFKNAAEFRDFIVGKLRSGLPVMVENMRFGGHWRNNRLRHHGHVNDRRRRPDPYGQRRRLRPLPGWLFGRLRRRVLSHMARHRRPACRPACAAVYCRLPS